MKRWTLILIGLLALFGNSWAAPPTVGERSVVSPGLWWDASKVGNGFDIHITGPSQIFLIWYTYRSDGSPTWYSAQGQFDSTGKMTSDLLSHTWQNGQHAGHRAVGRIALQRQHAEAIEAKWTLDGADGQWQLQPFDVPGLSSEVDHTGIWYDPAQSGFGLSVLVRQSLVLAAYYFYDERGQATWALGQTTAASAPTQLTFRQFRGACPSCVPSAPQETQAFRGDLQWASDIRVQLDMPVASFGLPSQWQLRARGLQQISRSVAERLADRQLARFGDANVFDATLRAALLTPQFGGYGNVDFSASPPSAVPTAAAVSGTNILEAGVDEGDVLKSDGATAYTFAANDNARRNGKLRIASITPNLGAVNEVVLQAPATANDLAQAQLYLHNRVLLAVTGTPSLNGARPCAFCLMLPYGVYQKGQTHLELFDRSNPLAPNSTWRATLDGSMVGSRRIGGDWYVVTRFSPSIEGFNHYGTSPEILAQNSSLLSQVPTLDLIPAIRINGGPRQALVNPSEILLPPTADRVIKPEYVIVTRINLGNPADRDAVVMLGSAEAVYVSAENLYIASNRRQPQLDYSLGMFWNGYTSTDLHQFKLNNTNLTVTGSATLEGYLDRDETRAPLRFSEYNGKLRVVTVANHFGALGVNRLNVLSATPNAQGTLRIDSVLPNAQRPQPIGKPNELLYATRFVNNRLYAVTFQMIDPLYVIDLANPLDPKITGELSMPGYSEYLHPLGENLLLGFGKDAIAASSGDGFSGSWYQGLQVSLFDVRNPAVPQLLNILKFGKRGSDSTLLRDHHGLSVLAGNNGWKLAFPTRIHEGFPVSGNASEPWTWYNYTHSALQPLEVTQHNGQWALTALPPLVTDTSLTQSGSMDDAAENARSILFNDRMIYVEKGRFWSAPWTTVNPVVGPR